MWVRGKVCPQLYTSGIAKYPCHLEVLQSTSCDMYIVMTAVISWTAAIATEIGCNQEAQDKRGTLDVCQRSRKLQFQQGPKNRSCNQDKTVLPELARGPVSQKYMVAFVDCLT